MIIFVGSNKVVCGCFIRTMHGLPCMCELTSLQIQGYVVPLESIHVFWKKLQIEEHEVTIEESGTYLDLEKEFEKLKRYFSILDIVGQRSMKKKVWELTYSCTTYMCPPPMKYKPK